MEGRPRPFFISDPEESLGNRRLIFETNPFGTGAVYKALEQDLKVGPVRMLVF